MTKATIQGLMGPQAAHGADCAGRRARRGDGERAYVLTDTISKAFKTIFEGSYQNTSAVITGKEGVKGAASGKSTVSDSLLREVSALPGVASASGAIYDVSGTTDPGRPDRQGRQAARLQPAAPLRGFDPGEPKFIPLTLTAGDWAEGSDQIVIDAGTAKNEDYRGRRHHPGRRRGADPEVPHKRRRQGGRCGLDRRGDVRALRRADRAERARQEGRAGLDLPGGEARGGRRRCRPSGASTLARLGLGADGSRARQGRTPRRRTTGSTSFSTSCLRSRRSR